MIVIYMTELKGIASLKMIPAQEKENGEGRDENVIADYDLSLWPRLPLSFLVTPIYKFLSGEIVCWHCVLLYIYHSVDSASIV